LSEDTRSFTHAVLRPVLWVTVKDTCEESRRRVALLRVLLAFIGAKSIICFRT